MSKKIFQDKNEIVINWKCFDDNDLIHVNDNNYSVMQRFTRLATHHINSFYHIDYNEWHKCIVNCKLIRNVNAEIHNAHSLILTKDMKICDNNGKLIDIFRNDTINEVSYGLAHINHYIYKTIDEFLTDKLLKFNKYRYDLNINLFFDINSRTKEKKKLLKNF